MIHNLISSFCFSYFILCLGKHFAVCISSRSYILIKFLLLSKFVLGLNIFLLVLGNKVSFQFYFFQGLKIFSIRMSSFLPISILLFFYSLNILFDSINSWVSFLDFFLKVNDIFFSFCQFFIVNFKLCFHLKELFLNGVSFIVKFFNLFLILLT